MPKLLRALARKYGNRWSTWTGISVQAPFAYENATIFAGSTPVRPAGSGGTVSVPLCASRTPSVAPDGYGFATPSAGTRDQVGTCAPVMTTGTAARAARPWSADAGVAVAKWAGTARPAVSTRNAIRVGFVRIGLSG